MGKKKHCEDCRHCLPLMRSDARTIMRRMNQYGLTKVWKTVQRSVAWAIRQVGICVYKTEIVGFDDVACEEHWKEKE